VVATTENARNEKMMARTRFTTLLLPGAAKWLFPHHRLHK
jgi:hypothetical protein